MLTGGLEVSFSIYYKLQHKVTILQNPLTSFEKCLVDKYDFREKAAKMPNGGIRNWGKGHELDIKIVVIGIIDLNNP